MKENTHPQQDYTTALADLFKASAELRFHIKSLNLTRVETSPSWHRHTDAMKRAEEVLKQVPRTDCIIEAEITEDDVRGVKDIVLGKEAPRK